MILAAGVGSRLDPLTSQLPKPLCPVLGKPVMEHIVRLCSMHGFTELAANTHVMAEKIKEHFRDAKKNFGVNLNLVYEPNLTGVAGGIRSCRKYLTNDVILIIMGDALTDVNLTALYEAHIKGEYPVTIGLKDVEDTSQYGVAVIDKNNLVTNFQEKPKIHEAKSNLANTGIYFFNQSILNEIPPESEAPKFDVATDLFQRLMSKKIPMQGININSYWADIGTLKQYLQSIKDALEGRVKIAVTCKAFEHGFIESGAVIDPSVKIQGKVYIGENVKIGQNVILNGSVCIENNCTIGANSYINNSIIWSNSKIGKNVKIINSILGNNCTVSEETEIISNSVWAPDTLIKSGIKPNVILK
jgi:NDP-sugar pyrophosphorylase family protein